jgi:cyanophycinase
VRRAPVHLVGGGWEPAAATTVYGPFLADAAELADRVPTIACVVLDEGDGGERFNQWAQVLPAVADCRPWPVLVPIGSTLDPAALGAADALLVSGGLTPGYADALVPVADAVRGWLADGPRPYLGFSAGAAIASDRAIVGGWRVGDVTVCPEDAGEDLDQLTLVPGLGLTKWSVDVHCAQWGTLPRLIETIRTSPPGHGWGNGMGIDENTVVSFDPDGRISVAGLGRAWLVHRGGGRGQAQVTPVQAGVST